MSTLGMYYHFLLIKFEFNNNILQTNVKFYSGIFSWIFWKINFSNENYFTCSNCFTQKWKSIDIAKNIAVKI